MKFSNFDSSEEEDEQQEYVFEVQLIGTKDVTGAVSAITAVEGVLLAALGSRVYIFSLRLSAE